MDNFYSEKIVSFLSTSAPHAPKEQDYIITNEKNVY